MWQGKVDPAKDIGHYVGESTWLQDARKAVPVPSIVEGDHEAMNQLPT